MRALLHRLMHHRPQWLQELIDASSMPWWYWLACSFALGAIAGLALVPECQAGEVTHYSTVDPHCIVDGIAQVWQPGCVMMGPPRKPVTVKQEQPKQLTPEEMEARRLKEKRRRDLAAYYKRMDELNQRYSALAGQGRIGEAAAISKEISDLEYARIQVLLGGAVPVTAPPTNERRPPEPPMDN